MTSNDEIRSNDEDAQKVRELLLIILATGVLPLEQQEVMEGIFLGLKNDYSKIKS